jgi:hypothetical protein
VLAGEAVFVYDSDEENFSNADHIGVTEKEMTDNAHKKFDAVQDMLNQVLPRKRTIIAGDTIDVANNTYAYLDSDDGIYTIPTKNAVTLFKSHFNIDNQDIANQQNSFYKLMQDYGLKTAATDWKDKIIDKETLVGLQQRSTDVTVNTAANNNDTGLYELYTNVVKKFVDNMIAEAERYASDEVEKDWKARTGEGPDQHGAGMSYCFGCKDNIKQFNGAVVNCPVDSTQDIIDRENDGNQTHYRGNIGPLNNQDCQIGGAAEKAGKWPGLIDVEQKQWVSANYPTSHVFDPKNWAGIDCSGFVQRAIVKAKSHEKYAQQVNIQINSIKPSPGLELVGASGFFSDTHSFYKARKGSGVESSEETKILRKGDLIKYGGHISMVYSDKADDDGKYEIIHAFGPDSGKADIDNDDKSDKVFARKVTKTANYVPDELTNPKGYGRIRLWE